MSVVTVRGAEPADAPFLARGILESDRGHVGVGTWDFVLPGPDAERLAVLASAVTAAERTYLHWTTFLVGEIDGTAAGCVARYVPDEFPDDDVQRVLLRTLERKGWDEDRLSRSLEGARGRDYCSVRIPGDATRIEWVFTDPTFRGRGVSSALIARHLGACDGDAYVGTYIGNAPAVATYQKAGFEPFAEWRHADYERRFTSPGAVLLRRLVRAPVAR
jgi:GNAT superfamily N-acetyltransferase